MLLHPSTNFEIQKYYQNESRFNGFYSTNNMQGWRICNKSSWVSGIGTHWIVLDALNNNIANFDSFEAEHIPKKFKNYW